MRLHYFPGTISIAIAIALEEAALSYEPVLVDFNAGEQTKTNYLTLNPKGRVPLLEIDGSRLTETGAILEFIAAKSPHANMIPSDPLQAAHMRSVMYYLASTMHVNHAHKMRGHRWANEQSSFDDMTAKVAETMTDSARYVENYCLTGPFVLGERFSIADPYLFIMCNWLAGDNVDVSIFPRLTAFLATMEKLASVKAVRAKGMLT